VHHLLTITALFLCLILSSTGTVFIKTKHQPGLIIFEGDTLPPCVLLHFDLAYCVQPYFSIAYWVPFNNTSNKFGVFFYIKKNKYMYCNLSHATAQSSLQTFILSVCVFSILFLFLKFNNPFLRIIAKMQIFWLQMPLWSCFFLKTVCNLIVKVLRPAYDVTGFLRTA